MPYSHIQTIESHNDAKYQIMHDGVLKHFCFITCSVLVVDRFGTAIRTFLLSIFYDNALDATVSKSLFHLPSYVLPLLCTHCVEMT